VLVGSGMPLYDLKVDWDLSNQTSVTDLLDIALAVDGLMGYVSFFVPLAESLDKPLFCVWSQQGLKASNKFVSAITPKKILEKRTSSYVIDVQEESQQRCGFDAFLGQTKAARSLSG
jgi:hypothetical protein